MQILNAASYLTRFDAPNPIALAVKSDSFCAPEAAEGEFAVDELPDNARDALRSKIRVELSDEFNRLLQQERAAAAEQLREMRARWISEESEALSKRCNEAIELSVKEIRDDVARILTPVASQAVCAIMLDDLVKILDNALRSTDFRDVTLSGAPDFIAAAREALAQRNIHAAIEMSEGIDISASSGATIIQTQLGAWLRHISGANEVEK